MKSARRATPCLSAASWDCGPWATGSSRSSRTASRGAAGKGRAQKQAGTNCRRPRATGRERPGEIAEKNRRISFSPLAWVVRADATLPRRPGGVRNVTVDNFSKTRATTSWKGRKTPNSKFCLYFSSAGVKACIGTRGSRIGRGIGKTALLGPPYGGVGNLQLHHVYQVAGISEAAGALAWRCRALRLPESLEAHDTALPGFTGRAATSRHRPWHAKVIWRGVLSRRNTSFFANNRFERAASKCVAASINRADHVVPPLGHCDPCSHGSISDFQIASARRTTRKDNREMFLRSVRAATNRRLLAHRASSAPAVARYGSGPHRLLEPGLEAPCRRRPQAGRRQAAKRCTSSATRPLTITLHVQILHFVFLPQDRTARHHPPCRAAAAAPLGQAALGGSSLRTALSAVKLQIGAGMPSISGLHLRPAPFFPVSSATPAVMGA
jgi:hypothetical protein